MNYFKYALLALSISNFTLAMEDTPKFKGGSVQDLLDSKPNYQICMLSECCLESLPDSTTKFTSVKGIENIPDIKEMRRINFDNNLIRLVGSPFVGLGLKCTILTLNSNGIEHFNPSFFEGLDHLERLELERNCFKSLPKPKDWKPLAQLRKLREVRFINNTGVPTVPEYVEEIPGELPIQAIRRELPNVRILFYEDETDLPA